jgi:hypothetical protein
VRLVALLLASVAVGCATGTSYVRDPEGRPLPTSARLDADADPVTVLCDDREYMIVEPPPPYLSGNHVGTSQVHVRDSAELCAKIRALD